MLLTNEDLAEAKKSIEWDLPESSRGAGNLAILVGRRALRASKCYNGARSTCRVNIRLLASEGMDIGIFGGKDIGSGLDAIVTRLPGASAGALSLKGLNSLRAADEWADSLCIPGGLGRSSETSLLLSKFIADSSSHVVLSGESASLAVMDCWSLKDSPGQAKTLVTTYQMIQKLSLKSAHGPLIPGDGIKQNNDLLASIAGEFNCCFIFERLGMIFMVTSGEVKIYNAGLGGNSDRIWSPKFCGHISALLSANITSEKALEAACAMTFS